MLCRCNGTLEVFSLPHMRRVATFLELHEGEAAMLAVPPPARVRIRTLHACTHTAAARYRAGASSCCGGSAVSPCATATEARAAAQHERLHRALSRSLRSADAACGKAREHLVTACKHVRMQEGGVLVDGGRERVCE